jgi:hypothetical protein
LGDRFRFSGWFRRVAVFRTNADGSNTISAVIEENAEIVLVLRSARAGLLSPQPPFRAEVLEERMEAVAPVMVTRFCREGTGYGLGPAVVIEEAGIVPPFL